MEWWRQRGGSSNRTQSIYLPLLICNTSPHQSLIEVRYVVHHSKITGNVNFEPPNHICSIMLYIPCYFPPLHALLVIHQTQPLVKAILYTNRLISSSFHHMCYHIQNPSPSKPRSITRATPTITTTPALRTSLPLHLHHNIHPMTT